MPPGGQKMNYHKNQLHVVDGRAMPIGKMVSFVILPFGNPKRHRSRETWPHFDQALYQIHQKTLFWLLVLVFWFFSKELSFFIPMKSSLALIWGMVYFCTRNGFIIILKKASSQLICTQLYLKNFWTKRTSAYLRYPHSRNSISRGLPEYSNMRTKEIY